MKPVTTLGHGAPASEEMRRLVHVLGAGPGRIVEFIAARPGEGTSTVAREFAVAYAAETGAKAQVLDLGSWERSGTATIAGRLSGTAAESPGTSVALRPTDVAAAQPNAAILARDQPFWQSLRGSGEAVIIDAPSLHASFDGVVVAPCADVVVLVVEAETTRLALIEHLRRTLESAGATIAGLVMTKRRLHIPQPVYRLL